MNIKEAEHLLDAAARYLPTQTEPRKSIWYSVTFEDGKPVSYSKAKTAAALRDARPANTTTAWGKGGQFNALTFPTAKGITIETTARIVPQSGDDTKGGD